MSTETETFETEETSNDATDLEEYTLLTTRSKSYKHIDFSSINPSVSVKRKVSTRKTYALQCKNHDGQTWSKLCDYCPDCNLFKLIPLPNGKLPSVEAVMGYLFMIRSNELGTNVELNVAKDLMLHWVYCNVYTLTLNHVVKKVTNLTKEYKYLKDYPKAKKRIHTGNVTVNS